jgi:hypothetical protein
VPGKLAALMGGNASKSARASSWLQRPVRMMSELFMIAACYPFGVSAAIFAVSRVSDYILK